jgi:hypothetical protein
MSLRKLELHTARTPQPIRQDQTNDSLTWDLRDWDFFAYMSSRMETKEEHKAKGKEKEKKGH